MGVCWTCQGAGLLAEPSGSKSFRCPGCFGTGSASAVPTALHAIQHTRDKAASDKRVRQLHGDVWSIAGRVEWDAEDWKDFSHTLTEFFARVTDRHAAKAGHRPLRANRRSRNHEHEDATTAADS